ncbi:MAG: 23S rRNA (guanosine(2251)-2'-O)-methyltransferase RlmB [Beijerinckiaceae bacterium]
MSRNRTKGPQRGLGEGPRGRTPAGGAKPVSEDRDRGGKRGPEEKRGAQQGVRPWERDRRREAAAGPRPARDSHLIWGFHSVREALRAGRRKLLRLTATSAAAEKLAPEIAQSGVAVSIAGPDDIDAALPDGAVHQGVLLEAGPLPDADLDDLPSNALLLVLDQVTDPHNVGAIVRTAAAFGVNAIVTTERHSPALGGVLAKAASGGLEHVDVITVVNLARALDTLGEMGFLRIGLDSDGPQSLAQTPLVRPLALVLGAEGKGLRRLSREKCDALARIDLPGAVRSLNVSNACAVALTIASMRLGDS